MSKLQRSSTKEEDADEDLGSVDSWDPLTDTKGVITDDGEYSISPPSDIGNPKGLSAKQRAAMQERMTLAVKETRAIFCLRLVVLLTLMVIGVSFALALFYHTKAAQEQEFEEQFGFYRDQVFEKFNRNIERKLNALDSLSTDMTSYAKSSGSEFPFVTVPDFEFRGANARISGDSIFIIYTPYITEALKLSWENYTAANRVHAGIALDSEEKSKIAQDQLFGLTPPKIDGLAGEYLKLLDTLNGTKLFDTTKIWTSVLEGTHVSGLPLALELPSCTSRITNHHCL